MVIPKILAIDFDCTIANTDFPEIKGLMKDSKECINKLYDLGYYIIIWTCRTGKDLELAEMFLFENKIKYHKINDHCPYLTAIYGNGGKKVCADYYIDDKNIFGLKPWKEMFNYIIENDKI